MNTRLQRLLSFRKNPLAQNATWMFAGQGFSFVIQGFYFVLLARLLGTSQYGAFVGAVALVSIASQFSSWGSGLLFLRYVSLDKKRFAEYWGNILLSTAGIGSVLVLLLYVFRNQLVSPRSASLLLMVALSDCLCGQLTIGAGQVFQTFERMRLTATLNLLINVLRTLIALAMLFFMHKATAYQWAIASLSVSAISAGLALVIVAVTFGRPVFKPRLLFSRAAEGFVFAVSGSTTSVYNDIDKAMMGHFGMDIANGIYTMAYRVIDISTMPIRSIQAAAFPRFFQYGAKGVLGTEPFARKLLKSTSIFGLLAAVGLFIVAPLIPLVVGKGFAPSVSALRWLCLIPFFRCFHLSSGDAMAGAGFQSYRLISQLFAAAGNFGMNLYLIPHYSWLGAAWASLITDGGLGVLNWIMLLALKRKALANSAASMVESY